MNHRKAIAALMLGTIIAACSSPSPSTSSSSHWATCKVFDDCSGVPGAASCESGYCLDAKGERIVVHGTLPEVDAGPIPCDPLTPHELAIDGFGRILGAGKDPSGKLYLADELTEPKQTDRVFVSEGMSLFRKRITGSGQSGGGADTDYNFSFEDGNDTHALLIQIRGGKTTGLGLGAGGRGFFGDPGAVTTELTIEDPFDAAKGYTLRNLPGDVTIEYVADLDDGNALVVTRPTDDWDYTDFKAFFGSPGAMAQVGVLNVARTRSGGTTIRLAVADATYEATFPFVIEPGPDGGVNSHPEPGMIDEAGKVVGFTQRWPTPKTLDGFSFTCFPSQKRL